MAFPETDERKRKLCLYLGSCHFESGDVEAAERRLLESVPPNCEHPLWTQAQFHLGRVYFQKGAYVKAKESFERCEFFGDKTDTELMQGLSTWHARIATHLPANSRIN